MHTPSTSTWLFLAFAALAAAQNSSSSIDPAAESSISSIAAKLETAYTTDPGWNSFQAAESSWLEEFSTTNTFGGPGFTSELSSFLATQTSSAAIESWVAAKTEAAVEAVLTGVVAFASTQTYLNDDVRTSVVSDYQVLASLIDPDGPDAPTGAPGNGTGNFTRTTNQPSRATTTITSNSITFSTLPTGSPTTTPGAPAAGTTGAAASLELSGLMAGAIAGAIAIVGMM